MSVLRGSRLSKSFGGVHAVKDVSFSLEKGQCLAMIGPNGAGKTTLFNMLGGQLKPDHGKVCLDDHDITGLPPTALFYQGIGRTFQIAQVFKSMSVVDNVQMAVLSHQKEASIWWKNFSSFSRENAMQVLEKIGISHMAQIPCAHLNYGDIKRVELAIALAGSPKVLLMDEPTAGMAEDERVKLMTLVRHLAKEEEVSVLFTEHDMESVFSYADRIMVMVGGSVLATGTPQGIAQNHQVQQAYLGSASMNL